MRKTYWLLLFFICLPAAALEVPVPAPPGIAGTGYIVVDFNSGQVIAEDNADQRMEPASITKLMTGYIAFSAIANGNLDLEEMVTVSDKAYRTVGSRMFIELRKPVSVKELLMGMIVQSGNDASVALAEHIAGSEDTFAQLMNQYAEKLGMTGTHYQNSTGLPGPEHYSTPRDIAILTVALIHDYPDFYKWYSIREYSYNGITQYNRNTLLWRDGDVDGVKTGFTDSAGYCLVASAKRDDMRLISVVMGTADERARADASQSLLTYGFRFFETHKLYEPNNAITQARVWKGAEPEVALGVAQALYITIPRGNYDALQAEMDLRSIIVAPVSNDEQLGQVRVTLGNQIVGEAKLFPLVSVESGNIFRRALDEIMLWFE